MTAQDSPAVRLRPDILGMASYQQGRVPAADGFKLSSNENPYPPLPGVIEAVNVVCAQLNRYPDASALPLRSLLAERSGVGIDQVHLGAGSVALLAQFIAAAAGDRRDVIYAWRSFEAYPGLVTVAGARNLPVPNRPDGGHDLDAMADAITDSAGVVIVCTPNNPTGPIVTRAEFRRFMARVPSTLLVLLDEAYGEFVTDPEAVEGRSLLAEYPNLVVLRTFSKAYGLAALRIGYAVGPAPILAAARIAAVPLGVTDQAQAAALASLQAEDELMERVARIALRRDRLREALREQGWNVPEAQGNFIWLPTGQETTAAADLFFDAGLTVRPFAGDGIRISVGEPESVDRVLKVARQIVGNLPRRHPAKRLG